jgi:hypothetical protein
MVKITWATVNRGLAERFRYKRDSGRLSPKR